MLSLEIADLSSSYGSAIMEKVIDGISAVTRRQFYCEVRGKEWAKSHKCAINFWDALHRHDFQLGEDFIILSFFYDNMANKLINKS